MARVRTREEKLADARQTIVKLEQETIAQAIELRGQAKGWKTRAEELVAKAEGAEAKADKLLAGIGQDPGTFWAEHDGTGAAGTGTDASTEAGRTDR